MKLTKALLVFPISLIIFLSTEKVNAEKLSLNHLTYILPIDSTKDSLAVANVFSPNGDGLNDIFTIANSGMKELHYEIYDRWGIKIFEASHINEGWDGRTTSGMPCSTGVYYYVLHAKAFNGNEYNKKGFLQLLR